MIGPMAAGIKVLGSEKKYNAIAGRQFHDGARLSIIQVS